MLKNFRKLIILVLVIATLGFGCSGPSQADLAAVQPVTLNYWTVFNDVNALRQLAASYQAQRTHVTVNIRQVRFEEFENLFVNALADDVSPDIVSMHARWLRQYQNRLSPMPASVRVANAFTQGRFKPETVVNVFNERMPTQNAIRGNYVRTVADDVIVAGQVYGLPVAVDTMALYYNKDLLDKSGVPLAPSTWEEFLAAVEDSTKFNSGGDILQSGVALGTGTNIDNAADILSLLMMQNGATVANRGVAGFAAGLDANFDPNSHPAFAALRFYSDFARPTKEVYSWNSNLGNAFDAFVNGRSVFYFGYAFDRARIRARAPQMSLEVIPVPQLNASAPINVANYWVESVPLKSTNQNEAWDFVRFMTLPENIKAYTDITGQPSPLRLHITDQIENPDTVAFASQILQADNWYRGRNWEAAQAALEKMITDTTQVDGDSRDAIRRQADLILNTARTIQQTF